MSLSGLRKEEPAMNVASNMADATVFACLDHLPYDVKQEDLENWVNQVNTLSYSYQRLSTYSAVPFWSTVLHNSSFLYSFDSVLESLPRGHSLDRFRLVYRWNEAAQKAVYGLVFQIFLIYSRIHFFPSGIDRHLSKEQWVDFTQNRGLMTLSRAAQVWSIYPLKLDYFGMQMERVAKVIPNLPRSIKDLCDELKSTFDHYEQAVPQLLEKFSLTTGAQQIRAAGLVRKFMYLVADCIFSTAVVIEVMQKAKIYSKDFSSIVGRVPILLEAIGRAFPVGVLMDVAAVLPGWPMRTLLQMNSQIEQRAIRLYLHAVEVSKKELTSYERFAQLQPALKCERFLFLIKEFDGLGIFLAGMTVDERKRIDEAVQTACRQQQKVILERVEDQGLLKSLGEIDRLEPEKKKAFELLKGRFPEMSNAYLHLCLRNFNYNAPYAIESMQTLDHTMPMDLRHMEHLARASRPNYEPQMPTVSYRNQDLVKSAVRPRRSHPPPVLLVGRHEEKPKNSFKGLFSMAPTAGAVPSRRPDSPTKQPVHEAKRRSSLPDIIDTLRGELDRSKLRSSGAQRHLPNQRVEEGLRGERLVPMHEVQRLARFKTSDADRAAIRPTYEQFKYETRFEEDDLYEDEYDDGYEEREFKVEPLNHPLSSEAESEEEGEKTAGAQPTGQTQRGVGALGRGFRGREGGGRGRGRPQEAGQDGGQGHSGGNANYTGGHQRQMKERHKNEWKQRGADRKRRGAFIA